MPISGEVPEGETAPDPSDVVIDYDEAFDPPDTSGADVATKEEVTVTNGVAETEKPPPSPKRSRSFDAVEGREEADEDLAAGTRSFSPSVFECAHRSFCPVLTPFWLLSPDAKRPRLGESETNGPAEAATA